MIDKTQLSPGIIVLVRADAVQTGLNHARREAIITEVFDNSVKLTHAPEGRRPADCIIGIEVITDILREPDLEDLQKFGLITITPENYTTGTYILCNPDYGSMPHLVEVDRVGDNYYWHFAGDAQLFTLEDDTWGSFQQFSDDPSGSWEGYEAEPGMYLNPYDQLVEVVPFAGRSFWRHIDQPSLVYLTPSQSKKLRRVESDTIDINAVAIIDTANAELQSVAAREDDETVLARETERTTREPRPDTQALAGAGSTS
jgi:hypothetical protein